MGDIWRPSEHRPISSGPPANHHDPRTNLVFGAPPIVPRRSSNSRRFREAQFEGFVNNDREPDDARINNDVEIRDCRSDSNELVSDGDTRRDNDESNIQIDDSNVNTDRREVSEGRNSNTVIDSETEIRHEIDNNREVDERNDNNETQNITIEYLLRPLLNTSQTCYAASVITGIGALNMDGQLQEEPNINLNRVYLYEFIRQVF